MDGFWSWWQHLPEKMDPVLFAIGSFRIQYYGLMYILAFATVYLLAVRRTQREPVFGEFSEHIVDLMTWMILGLMVGARLGYVLFYNLAYYLENPLEIFLPFSFSNGFHFTGISGMSYHGGAIGVAICSLLYLRRAGLDFWKAADLFAPVVPLGYTFGRIGNFINGELYGRATTLPVGMYFPAAGDNRLRHPSQLYEAFFEGIVLFLALLFLRRYSWPKGAMLSFYLFGYGFVRFFIEYFRQPDAHLGFVFLSFSMGQILCFLMMAAAVILYAYLRMNDPPSRLVRGA